MNELKIVKKGTPEFRAAAMQLLKLFEKTQPENTICAGMIGMKTRQLGKLAKIPMPFGCPDLEVYIWGADETQDGKTHVAWFCGRIGCLCSCCREDMEGSYPDYCPDPDELHFNYDPEEDHWSIDF